MLIRYIQEFILIYSLYYQHIIYRIQYIEYTICNRNKFFNILPKPADFILNLKSMFHLISSKFVFYENIIPLYKQ